VTVILPEVLTLTQHKKLLQDDVEVFRPQQCPSCGKSELWCHGHYDRKADYENCAADSLNPVAIPRFYCSYCCHTCSVLPECLPPQRHYPWLIQQEVLRLLLAGVSIRALSRRSQPSRWTISRWWRRLSSQFLIHADHFRSYLSFLGRITTCQQFWGHFLNSFSLSSAMLSLHHAGVTIP